MSKFPKYELWSGSWCTAVKIPEARIMKRLIMHYCQNSRRTNYEAAHDALLSQNSRSTNYEVAHNALLSKFPKHELWRGSWCTNVKIPEARIMKRLMMHYCKNSQSTNYEAARDALLSQNSRSTNYEAAHLAVLSPFPLIQQPWVPIFNSPFYSYPPPRSCPFCKTRFALK